MVHYYLALALPAPLLLLATLASGLLPGAPLRHVALGLITAILCVAAHTLLILFMIVTGRVLKAAMHSRELPRAFLDELNDFFARRRAYPLALVSAAATAATAVLGYGRYVGVPLWVHVACGAGIVALNPWALWLGLQALRANQRLVDRAARELDELDRRGVAPRPALEPALALRGRQRALVFALCAWLPALYWGLVVWRGDLGRVPLVLWALCGLTSLAGLLVALRAPRCADERAPPDAADQARRASRDSAPRSSERSSALSTRE